jgi:hypothetical protein
MLDPLYVPNSMVNSEITEEEIHRAVMRSLENRVVLTSSRMKSNTVRKILHKMFILYFATGINPSLWRKAIICPLLGDPSSDPLFL